MGLHEIPTFYKEILSHYAGKPDQQIIYLGHSQGISQMFVALADPSTKAFIRKHTERFMALAPIVYLTKVKEKALKIISKFNMTVKHLLESFGIRQYGSIHCDSSNPEKGQKGLQGPHLGKDGASLRQLVHYGQLVNGDAGGAPVFRKYNYGSTEANNKAYGVSPPPEWSFDDWTTPLNLVGFGNDTFGT
jgi:hypothetical protein